MIWRKPLNRFFSLLALCLTAMVATSPSALAVVCSCECIDGVGMYVCVDDIVGGTAVTDECTDAVVSGALVCPALDEPPPDPEPTATADPVATIEPPHPGLHCERRSLYRPDLGEYKKYKVCKPSAEKKAKKHHHNSHARNTDAWAARHERMMAKWAAHSDRHGKRHGHHSDDDDDS